MASSDTHNFSSSSPHRLPTLSASQALQNLNSTPRRPVSTGLTTLDSALHGRAYDASDQNSLPGGIARGEVTEIYGPPGVGKTAFAMQVSASALGSGNSVVWVDASSNMVTSRLIDIISGSQSGGKRSSTLVSAEKVDECMNNLHHFSTPTLPHLLALLNHQSTGFPPSDTSVIVIDSVATVFALAFPKSAENPNSQQTPIKRSDAMQGASGRRWAVMGDFISKIGRLAATRNIAVLITNQMNTRIRSDAGAMLHPAVSGTAWDSGIRNRIVLFRDWMFRSNDASSSQGDLVPGVRFAGVMKAKAISYDGVGRVVAFQIEKYGLFEVKMAKTEISLNASSALPAVSMKRKRGEIADSESDDEEAASDHEFGWAGDGDALNADGLLDGT